MAYRRLTRNLPVQHSQANESTEANWKRLRPDWYEGYSDDWTWHTSYDNNPATRHGNKPSPNTAAADQTIARKDEPLVRHLRRGTTNDALAALEEKGATALVDVVLKDRCAKGTAEANASLVRTWHRFHEEAFGHAHPPVPVLPLTTRSLVMIGSLFKAGGYRSYPNYVSIMKTKHIEDGHEWGQLIQHTSAWVTRSVMRGIGPDRQSCSFDVPKPLCSASRPCTTHRPGTV